MTRRIATALLLSIFLLALQAPAAAQATFTDLGSLGGGEAWPAATQTVMLEARRHGNDKNGREYRFVVTAVDNGGNSAPASATTVVPHDQGKK